LSRKHSRGVFPEAASLLASAGVRHSAPYDRRKGGSEVRSLRIALTLCALSALGVHDDRWEFLGTYTLTACCPCPKCCSPFANASTADGTRLKRDSHVVAAPPEITFGTMLSVPGCGEARVADRGQAIVGRRLDVFLWTHDEALEWGVKQAKVWRRR
jgi:3D (Asp-Asp-Asp) domain-containing protein